MVTIHPFPRVSERRREQADQAPGRGISPSERVRLHSSDCRFWGFLAGITLAIGFPAMGITIEGAGAIWLVSGLLMREALKCWDLYTEAVETEMYFAGIFQGRRQAVEEYQKGYGA
jgi:hypothetical protein